MKIGSYIKDFKKRLDKKEIKIAIVGLGYVGLPIAISFAEKGFSVVGIEVDSGRLKYILKKESYISDVPTIKLRRAINSGRFKAAGDFKMLKQADVIIICVPTPLKRKYFPNISYIQQAVKSVAKNIKTKCLVILESTTYPGTTEEVILPLLEKGGLKHGEDFYLCFSPERIDPGNEHYPLEKIPKVIGGLNKEATQLAGMVYSKIICKVVLVSSSRVAEVTKLLENTFRLVNIGLIDELAMMCHKMKIDIWEVISAAKTKPFGFMPFYPGPGVGGHCIPKDPLYLYWKAKKFGFKSRFIKLASDMIAYMPHYVVKRMEELLAERGKKLKGSKVLVVGATYKKDIKDLRKSPALDIIEILKDNNCLVSYFDPLIPYLKFNRIDLKSIDLKKAGLDKFDGIIIATDHSCVDYRFILKHSRLILDTRNVYKDVCFSKIYKL